MKTTALIGIVGPVGAGKTTLAERLSERLRCHVHFEEPADNPYLKRFYAELTQDQPSEVALKSQLHFLLASYRQAVAIGQNQETAIWDVPLYGHKMYADLLFESGKMPADDYHIYQQVYQNCIDTMPKPDVMVVVTSPLKQLVKQIRRRGREMELSTPEEYWQRQIQYWEKADEHIPTIPIVKLSSDQLDWRKAAGLDQVVEALQTSVSSTSFFRYLYAT